MAWPTLRQLWSKTYLNGEPAWNVFVVGLFQRGLVYPRHPARIYLLPLIVIALSRVTDGLTGGNMAVTQAYVSDITSHEEKGWIFGTMGGISGIAMIVGPGVGGT